MRLTMKGQHDGAVKLDLSRPRQDKPGENEAKASGNNAWTVY